MITKLLVFKPVVCEKHGTSCVRQFMMDKSNQVDNMSQVELEGLRKELIGMLEQRGCEGCPKLRADYRLETEEFVLE